MPDWAQVDDPETLCLSIARWLEGQGVQFRRDAVDRLQRQERGAALHFASGEILQAGTVVIACGAWSRTLASHLGDKIPLDTERGYNITIPDPGVEVRRFIMLPGHGFVLSPLVTGLRVGGAVEFGGLDLSPNWKRVAAMVSKARSFFPGLETKGGQRWMGFRPSIPDSLPVIGPATRAHGVYYAFGHAHHGLTQSAVTGEMIADMIEDKPPAVDAAPFSAGRF